MKIFRALFRLFLILIMTAAIWTFVYPPTDRLLALIYDTTSIGEAILDVAGIGFLLLTLAMSFTFAVKIRRLYLEPPEWKKVFHSLLKED